MSRRLRIHKAVPSIWHGERFCVGVLRLRQSRTHAHVLAQCQDGFPAYMAGASYAYWHRYVNTSQGV